MAAENASKGALYKEEIQVPEWEHIASERAEHNAVADEKTKNRSFRETCAARFNTIVPPHRRYLRMRRRTFLLVLSGVILALLAVILGLAVGLAHQHGSARNLPLPSNTATFTGDLTYYESGLGACGKTSRESDDIVSVSHLLFDSAGPTSSNGGNSNANPLCNRMIRAQRYNEEVDAVRSVDLTVVDRCTGCAVDDIDVTEGAFAKLAPIAEGRVKVTWAWLS